MEIILKPVRRKMIMLGRIRMVIVMVSIMVIIPLILTKLKEENMRTKAYC